VIENGFVDARPNEPLFSDPIPEIEGHFSSEVAVAARSIVIVIALAVACFEEVARFLEALELAGVPVGTVGEIPLLAGSADLFDEDIEAPIELSGRVDDQRLGLRVAMDERGLRGQFTFIGPLEDAPMLKPPRPLVVSEHLLAVIQHDQLRELVHQAR